MTAAQVSPMDMNAWFRGGAERNTALQGRIDQMQTELDNMIAAGWTNKTSSRVSSVEKRIQNATSAM